MTFGTRLTEARKKKGLTQEGLGKGLGTDGKDASKAVVYGWEKDQHHPRADQLGMICERLGCSSDYLLFGRINSASDLLPEVARMAAEVNALPQKQREWVMSVIGQSLELARESLRVTTDSVRRDTEIDPPQPTTPLKRVNGR